jgi:hypothetical protein
MFVVPEDQEHLKVLWSPGVTANRIGAELGLSPASVCRRAQQLGLPRRSRKVSASDRAEFRALYELGLTVAEVATRTGFHRDTVRRALVRCGVTIEDRSRKWPVRHDAFAESLSPDAWYWVGMLAADGCVRGPSISLVQHTSRAAMLERFLEFVGSSGRPFRVINGGKGLVADLSSPHIAADLARQGVVPRKSLTLEASQEAAAQPLFWLGVFDGDGCCTFSKRDVPTIGIVGSRALMEQFAAFLHSQLGSPLPSVGRPGARLSDVRVSGDRARRIAELWLSLSTVSLETKRERLERAVQYASRMTRARLAVRRRKCDLCGAWVERMPSQVLGHVFCSRDHYWIWKRKPEQWQA